eukprot:CAMPEP_0194715974 /NCGR_PEP_ID=MMETSP0296-20130528/7712_1 /TAXON_ID=39354 /ORGANISM="Heterosigma akashiwo, Strain CCMP2393" /LENGTH=94 /DNA_ID=CAMNT_0039616119 /DNA_START=76 /DNA_END=357 /DNA_ORIENTATION=-
MPGRPKSDPRPGRSSMKNSSLLAASSLFPPSSEVEERSGTAPSFPSFKLALWNDLTNAWLSFEGDAGKVKPVVVRDVQAIRITSIPSARRSCEN